MLYMLDTNICGYMIRNRPYYIKDTLKEVELNHEIALSSIVVSELLFGAKKKGSAKLTKLVNTFIDNFSIYDFDKHSAIAYSDIRNELEKNGNIIGSNDLFISAHAKSLNAILVTNNIKEFNRIDGLTIENWIKDTEKF